MKVVFSCFFLTFLSSLLLSMFAGVYHAWHHWMLPGSWKGTNLLLKKWCLFSLFWLYVLYLLCSDYCGCLVLMRNAKLSHVSCLVLLVFFLKVMTWVWLLTSLSNWRIRPSLHLVCLRYHIIIKVWILNQQLSCSCNPIVLLIVYLTECRAEVQLWRRRI